MVTPPEESPKHNMGLPPDDRATKLSGSVTIDTKVSLHPIPSVISTL